MKQVLDDLMNTPEGRVKLARAMVSPLRTIRDYEQCPSCGVTMVIDSAVRKHPDDGCTFPILSDVMDT